jgi:hypothetical protein
MARAQFYLPVPIPLLTVLALGLSDLALELRPSKLPVMTTPAPPPPAQIISTAGPNLSGEAAILSARPLFRPSRRPFIAAPPPVPQPPRLSGIVVTGSGKYAVFTLKGGNPMIAATGQLIGAFKVCEITTMRVVVSGPSGNLTLLTSYPSPGSGNASNILSEPAKFLAPIVLPGGITLYPATSSNLPDAADWPGPTD